MLLAFPVVLFPALAEDVFERPELLGLLYTAETVGALVATAPAAGPRGCTTTAGPSCSPRAYGLFIGLAGLAPTIWVALGLLVLAGAADMISGVFRATVWSQTIPERCAAGWPASRCCPTPSAARRPGAGRLRRGLWSVRGSIASGGLACVAGVAIAGGLAARLLGYDARTDEHAVAERGSGGPRDSP